MLLSAIRFSQTADLTQPQCWQSGLIFTLHIYHKYLSLTHMGLILKLHHVLKDIITFKFI